MGLRRIPEFLHERMFLERGLHDAALHACAAPVNQPHFAQATLVRGSDVLADDRGDVARGEGVEIELRFNGDLVGVFRQIPSSPSQIPNPNHAQIPKPKANSQILSSHDWDLGVGRGWDLELGSWDLSYSAVTVVVIPPRAEKSPITVMRRGAQTATRSSRIWLVTAS